MSTTERALAGEDLYRGSDDFVWVENLRPEQSVFRHGSGATFRMAPRGYLGSVIEVPARVARDPYFRRSVHRGIIQFVTPERAEELNAPGVLKDLDEGSRATATRPIQDALAAGASETMARRYKDPNLPDSGRETGEITEEQVWGGKAKPKARPRQVTPAAVHGTEATTPPAPGEEPVEAPVFGEAALGERMREGELPPDTGR